MYPVTHYNQKLQEEPGKPGSLSLYQAAIQLPLLPLDQLPWSARWKLIFMASADVSIRNNDSMLLLQHNLISSTPEKWGIWQMKQ